MDFCGDALEILKQTSRTFYIPISLLPKELRKAVASAYLCMRAIDEIEDHDLLDNQTKAKLLQQISLKLQSQSSIGENNSSFDCLYPYREILPEVTLRIDEWSNLPSETIAPRIWDATAAMADRMAHWATVNWRIETVADLDAYTFSVAGAVGLMLSDIWAWYDGTITNRSYAIGFGRGLQTVNIIRNRAEDLSRGADFFPDGWQTRHMQEYARSQLKLGRLYTNALSESPALDFCRIPLALAFATLDAIALGKEKLSRSEVLSVVNNF